MKRIRIEVCIISARGLRRPSSLWKLQWYAVGWIDPNNKYCTKIDASGTKNPTWKTKFSALIDDDDDDDESKSPTLHIQVFSREPIFLREKLHGTATILLKEFLNIFYSNSSSTTNTSYSSSGFVEEVGSFQLRKKNSGKPQGFVDVSIRVFEEREGGGEGGTFPNYYTGNNEEGFELGGRGRGGGGEVNEIFIGGGQWSNVEDRRLRHHHHHPDPHQPPHRSHSQLHPAAQGGWSNAEDHHYPHQPYGHSQPQPHTTAHGGWSNVEDNSHPHQPRDQSQPHPAAQVSWSNVEDQHHPHKPRDYSHFQPNTIAPLNWKRQTEGTQSSNKPPPPPPPPPSHVGYLPTFIPRTDARSSGTYLNNRGPSGARNNNGVAMGMSAGALAAGAVLFGEDFMSGFDIPSSLQEETRYH